MRWQARWRCANSWRRRLPELVTPGNRQARRLPHRGRARPGSPGAGSLLSSRSRAGNIARQPVGGRQPGELVLGRQPRHGQCPAGQGGDGVIRKVAGGNESDLLADEDAQAQIGAFAALDIFQFAKAVGNAGGDIFHQQCIGGIGAGALGGIQQGGENGLGVAGHGIPMPQTLVPRRQLAVWRSGAGEGVPASVRYRRLSVNAK